MSKVLDKVDWPLLRKQKLVLVKMVMERSLELDEEEKAGIDGVIALLDGLQDEAVASGAHTEKEIFGDMGGNDEKADAKAKEITR